MKETSATYRVMIVDDEAILRTGMLHLCNWSEYGIEIVAQVSNGQEALQYIETVHPHVVITDIVMPIMDGVELTKIIRMQYPEIKVVVLSSYSEFNYVREVFKYGVTDYLLKPKVSSSELISLIQSLCSDLDLVSLGSHSIKSDPSLLLAQWLTNDSTQAEETLQEITQHFTSRYFRIAKASTNLILSRTNWTHSQMEQILIELATEHLAGLAYTCVFLNNEFLLLINYELEQTEAISSALQRFTDHARESLVYISFVLSNAFETFNLIKKEHERLTPYLGKLLYFPEHTLVNEDIILVQSDKIFFDQTHFTTALRIFAFDEASAELKAFFSTINSNQSYDEYSLKRFCQNLIYTAINMLEQLKQPISELNSSKLKLFKMIDQAFDIHELENILLAFLDNLKGIVRHSDQQQSMIIQQVYDYVNENYANDISLTEMSHKLHLNYSYLSSYFKQRTHENLTSYINRVRTDKAKELLLDYKLSISEISRLTGFSEHNYFSKVFKKMTGMTPVEYRNQISQ
ncbi:two-component system response regulator YesN [Paenibacillus anaericanus]|uniref:response regulator n=1 Tax=Paenibacillus anaericanus TaxID=170367 RepID=UPI0027887745|nr:response regulator [Paenibacillus anaericanus]MDQ0089595.1 two-component system response regulator YesN [Paenibacillus anaericanus]